MSIMSELAAWDRFYVIAGSAADALIGPQFVVLTLIVAHADSNQYRPESNQTELLRRRGGLPPSGSS